MTGIQSPAPNSPAQQQPNSPPIQITIKPSSEALDEKDDTAGMPQSQSSNDLEMTKSHSSNDLGMPTSRSSTDLSKTPSPDDEQFGVNRELLEGMCQALDAERGIESKVGVVGKISRFFNSWTWPTLIKKKIPEQFKLSDQLEFEFERYLDGYQRFVMYSFLITIAVAIPVLDIPVFFIGRESQLMGQEMVKIGKYNYFFLLLPIIQSVICFVVLIVSCLPCSYKHPLIMKGMNYLAICTITLVGLILVPIQGPGRLTVLMLAIYMSYSGISSLLFTVYSAVVIFYCLVVYMTKSWDTLISLSMTLGLIVMSFYGIWIARIAQFSARKRFIFSKQQEEKSKAVLLQATKSTTLVNNMLPQEIIHCLALNREEEAIEDSTQGSLSSGSGTIDRYSYVHTFPDAVILFAKINDFYRITAQLSASEIVEFLSLVFNEMDSIVRKRNLWRIKTIEGTFMLGINIPNKVTDPIVKALQTALDFHALDLVHPGVTEPVSFTIGFHGGAVVGAVIGKSSLTFDTFGDTVNIASRMCYTAPTKGTIQVLDEDFEKIPPALLKPYEIVGPYAIFVKGKGGMTCYTITPPEKHHQPLSRGHSSSSSSRSSNSSGSSGFKFSLRRGKSKGKKMGSDGSQSSADSPNDSTGDLHPYAPDASNLSLSPSASQMSLSSQKSSSRLSMASSALTISSAQSSLKRIKRHARLRKKFLKHNERDCDIFELLSRKPPSDPVLAKIKEDKNDFPIKKMAKYVSDKYATGQKKYARTSRSTLGFLRLILPGVLCFKNIRLNIPYFMNYHRPHLANNRLLLILAVSIYLASTFNDVSVIDRGNSKIDSLFDLFLFKAIIGLPVILVPFLVAMTPLYRNFIVFNLATFLTLYGILGFSSCISIMAGFDQFYRILFLLQIGIAYTLEGTYYWMRVKLAMICSALSFVGYGMSLKTVDGMQLTEEIISHLAIHWIGNYRMFIATVSQMEEAFLRILSYKRGKYIKQKKKQSDMLLTAMLPDHYQERLATENLSGKVIAEYYENVTLLFGDIQGFTAFSSTVSAENLVKMLGSIFSMVDLLCERHGLLKVKTLGDAIQVIGGCPESNRTHTIDMGNLALDFVEWIGQTQDVRFRIGIASGPIVGGIVGKYRIVFDVFGPLVGEAEFMESNGAPLKVHCSRGYIKALMTQSSGDPEFKISRNKTEELICDGDKIKTYWLEPKPEVEYEANRVKVDEIQNM